MKNEFQILDYLKGHIKELIPVKGLRIRFEDSKPVDRELQPDFILSVSYKDLEFKLVGEILPQLSSSIFRSKLSLLKAYSIKKKNLVPIIAAKYLSPDRRNECREEGVCFLDLSGNVFLEHDSVYVERIGFPNRFPEKRIGRGPFSDKASLILRAALSDIKKIWGIRELAHSIGLDPGFVSRMAQELEKRNYFSRVDSKLKLRDPKSLLEDWVREYDYKKNREARYFCLAKDAEEIIKRLIAAKIPNELRYALGLHAGAGLVAPYAVYNEFHIYIGEWDDINWFAEKLNLREADEGANIVFLFPYYKHSVFYDKQKINNLWVVSDLQLYLDLHNYPIRGLEQAEHIYEKRLKYIIED